MIQKEIKFFGKRVVLNMRNEGDAYIANQVLFDNEYRLCDEAIRKASDAVIDIGAHLGFFSIHASLLNPKIPIYAFEPYIGNYEILKMNLKENRIKNVIVRQLAVSDTVSQTELKLSKEDFNHSLIQPVEPTGETQTVQTTTLERIFTKNHIRRCDLIKIDCEGSEFPLLYTAPYEIFEKISNIFLEYHERADGASGDKLTQFLKERGYVVKKFPHPDKKALVGFLWCYK